MLKRMKNQAIMLNANHVALMLRELATRSSGLTRSEVQKRTPLNLDIDTLVRVLREGILREVPAKQLVPGDIVILHSGEEVLTPVMALADGRLLEAGTRSSIEGYVVVLRAPLHKDNTNQQSNLGPLVMSVLGLVTSVTFTLVTNEYSFISLVLGLLTFWGLIVGLRLISIKQPTLSLRRVRIGFQDSAQLSSVLGLTNQQRLPLVGVPQFFAHAGNAEVPQPILG